MGSHYVRGAGAGRASSKVFPTATEANRTPRAEVFRKAYHLKYGEFPCEEQLESDLRLKTAPGYVEAYLRLN